METGIKRLKMRGFTLAVLLAAAAVHASSIMQLQAANGVLCVVWDGCRSHQCCVPQHLTSDVFLCCAECSMQQGLDSLQVSPVGEGVTTCLSLASSHTSPMQHT